MALGCARSSKVPCHGFTGTCTDLVAVYWSFAATSLTSSGPQAVSLPSCNAFPTDSPTDTFLAGLISAACGAPVALLVSQLLALATTTDDAQALKGNADELGIDIDDEGNEVLA